MHKQDEAPIRLHTDRGFELLGWRNAMGDAADYAAVRAASSKTKSEMRRISGSAVPIAPGALVKYAEDRCGFTSAKRTNGQLCYRLLEVNARKTLRQGPHQEVSVACAIVTRIAAVVTLAQWTALG
jgi:hypothetical protein